MAITYSNLYDNSTSAWTSYSTSNTSSVFNTSNYGDFSRNASGTWDIPKSPPVQKIVSEPNTVSAAPIDKTIARKLIAALRRVNLVTVIEV